MSYVKVSEYINYISLIRRYPEIELRNEAVRRFKEWAEQNNITHHYAGSPHFRRLFQRNIKWDDTERASYEDHPNMFRSVEGKLFFIVQPYIKPVTQKEETEIKTWAKEKDLNVSISENLSWHYPGSTALIVYTKEGDGVKGLIRLSEVKQADHSSTYESYGHLSPFFMCNFNYSKSKKPKTAEEKQWYNDHCRELMECIDTGKCKCGSIISFENPLHNLGWEYGFECGMCK